jgi:hypothetical protein
MGMVEKGEMVGNAGTESLELIHSPESRKGTLRTVGFHSSHRMGSCPHESKLLLRYMPDLQYI